MGKVRSIPVVDAKGDKLTVYEYYDGFFVRKVHRRMLCTGEDVERIGSDMFVVLTTGEKLLQVD
jgi:hypothetical protein